LCPIVLIVGGRNKNMDLSYIRQEVRSRVKIMIAFGETAEEWTHIYKNDVLVVACASMREAVCESYKHSSDGDVVLLSPACASFDMFTDYKERGEVFKQCVKNIINKS